MKSNNKKKKSTPTLKVCTLSGNSEVGRNCNFIEYGNDILIIDAGFSFPGHELYGIDYLIPNIEYLKDNKHKIRGVLITHGHLDHTGALPYILPDLGYPPIYGGKFANALIKERLKEFDMEDRVKFINVRRNSKYDLGYFTANFIGVTHSIPNSYSIFIKSPEANVFFSGDYKIDRNPMNEPETDYERLKSLKGKVDLALLESTNAGTEGKAKSEKEIAASIEEIIRGHDGRIVVAAFSSLVSRLYSVIKIAQKTDRKVFISGRSLKKSMSIAQEQNYIEVPDGLIMDESKVKKYPDDKVIFLCTGSQAERYAALNRISYGEHNYFKIKDNDLIMLSASEIPGNILQIESMTDRLIAQGADLIQNDSEVIHESGHGLKEDIKIMYELIEPKEVVPIHGSMTLRYKNVNNYQEWGMSKDNVHLTKDGQIWKYNGNKWARGIQVPAKPILIDGLGVGDIGDMVIKDRQQLAEYGFVIVILNLSSKNKKLIGKPQFVSRGFVYVKKSKGLFNELGQQIEDIHRHWLSSKNSDVRNLRKKIEKSVKDSIYKKTEREPMILSKII
jgi:ribonuclease J